MSDIYTSIYTHLSGLPEFAALPVHYGQIPEGAPLPLIRFNVISSNYIGVSQEGAGLKRDRIQFDGVDVLVSAAAAALLKVRDALNNFQGVMGGGLDIQSCLPLGVGGTSFDEQNLWYLVRQDWDFTYQEGE
jgi:hypothetical protein